VTSAPIYTGGISRLLSSLGIERIDTAPAQGGGGQSAPTGRTDRSDYAPGTIVHISGTGWRYNQVRPLQLVESSTHPNAFIDTHPDLYATADINGAIHNDQFSPDEHDLRITFTLTATGPISGSATTVFTDSNPSGNLDQCANDSAPSPNTNGCSGAPGENG